MYETRTDWVSWALLYTKKLIQQINEKFKPKKTHLVKPDHKRLTIFGWLSSNLIGALAWWLWADEPDKKCELTAHMWIQQSVPFCNKNP